MTESKIKAGPKKLSMTPQEWCDYSNAKLAGIIPTSDGRPARDPGMFSVEWYVHDGRVCIRHKLRTV